MSFSWFFDTQQGELHPCHYHRLPTSRGIGLYSFGYLSLSEGQVLFYSNTSHSSLHTSCLADFGAKETKEDSVRGEGGHKEAREQAAW